MMPTAGELLVQRYSGSRDAHGVRPLMAQTGLSLNEAEMILHDLRGVQAAGGGLPRARRPWGRVRAAVASNLGTALVAARRLVHASVPGT